MEQERALGHQPLWHGARELVAEQDQEPEHGQEGRRERAREGVAGEVEVAEGGEARDVVGKRAGEGVVGEVERAEGGEEGEALRERAGEVVAGEGEVLEHGKAVEALGHAAGQRESVERQAEQAGGGRVAMRSWILKTTFSLNRRIVPGRRV